MTHAHSPEPAQQAAIPSVTDIVVDASFEDTITLDYEARFVRRKRLVCDSGRTFLIDLPKARALAEGEALRLSDGTTVAVRAAPEPLLEVRGALPRLAWHIGNRHTPCRIEADRLLLREDPVLATMLKHLGAEVTHIEAPFSPEGGAYGHGRTFGHSHAPDTHDHDHSHAHDHDQS